MKTLEEIVEYIEILQNSIPEKQVFILNFTTMQSFGDKITTMTDIYNIRVSYVLDNKYLVYPSFKIPENVIAITTETELEKIKHRL
jgi:hypothetical protein